MTLAYSYLRFSSLNQEDGDSTRRQDALRDAWLKRHPSVKLDTEYQDRGVSGFRGKHRTKGNLAGFLDLVQRGRVPAGSYLIVENLDRLTRENPWEAVGFLCSIVQAGIRVVTLSPSEMEYSRDQGISPLILACVEFGRGHSESGMKSERVGAAKRKAKQEARESGRPMGRMTPAWLELEGGKYRVKQDAAKAVRLIFRWCAQGLGILAVTRKLRSEGIPPIGRSGRWITSYVAQILDNRAVLGEYQPMSNGPPRVPDGDPIPNYYPPVVTEAEFYAAKEARESRKRRSGRPSKKEPCVFAGLLLNALDGDKIYTALRYKRKYLVAAKAINGEQPMVTFPLREFTEAVLSQLRELKASDLFRDPGAVRVAELTARLGEVERKLNAASVRWEADPESKHWGDRVSQYDRESRALAKELAEARQQAANPASGAWADVLSETDPIRLRAGLLRTVEAVRCVTVMRGDYRLCACQVNFKDSDRRRRYIVRYTPGRGGFGERPASWACWSLESVAKAGDLDLRKTQDARALSKVLERVKLPE